MGFILFNFVKFKVLRKWKDELILYRVVLLDRVAVIKKGIFFFGFFGEF